VRPLLPFTRRELLATSRSAACRVQDPANRDPRHSALGSHDAPAVTERAPGSRLRRDLWSRVVMRPAIVVPGSHVGYRAGVSAPRAGTALPCRASVAAMITIVGRALRAAPQSRTRAGPRELAARSIRATPLGRVAIGDGGRPKWHSISCESVATGAVVDCALERIWPSGERARRVRRVRYCWAPGSAPADRAATLDDVAGQHRVEVRRPERGVRCAAAGRTSRSGAINEARSAQRAAELSRMSRGATILWVPASADCGRRAAPGTRA